jgi:prolyl-tRNA editing enzyme YbaK/EbsC (Cys-tRNA(Pro) deacylase)
MDFGKLTFQPVTDDSALVAKPVNDFLESSPLRENVFVSEIDPSLSDTSAFCATYDIAMEVSANCVILEAKRAERTWYAACMILATDKADVNGKIRRLLDARKISFAPMGQATSLTGMEFGGITPIGLPADWIILVDEKILTKDEVIIGSGIRKSKLLLPGKAFTMLPNVTILDLCKSE